MASRMAKYAADRYGIPEGGVTVTFAWNEVALAVMLDALREHYPSGYASMLDHVRAGTPRGPLEGGK